MMLSFVNRAARLTRSATIAAAMACVAHAAGAQQQLVKPNAGLLRYPAVSAKQIVFVYADKLWLAPHDGGVAIPLATPAGRVVFPRFSPDNLTVGFTANYDGNPDLYTIPVEGGIPNRVTHHPAAEVLCNWTPDGKLLFAANYGSGVERTTQLYTVSPKGGMPTKLPVPYGNDASISPDGKMLAYTPDSTNFRTWKRYRGGWAQDIWLFDLQKRSAKRITDWEGTDTLPMWHGKTIYYLSDGGPEHRLNIWKYETQNAHRSQETHFTDYDLKWPSIGPGAKGEGEIIFEHGSELDILDLATNKTHSVDIRIPGDRGAMRPREVDVVKFIDPVWSISPNGKRAAVAARGDIWTLPAKNGSPRNLTHSNSSAERYPAWSPDGEWVAYLSDATGEYEIYVTHSDGKGEARQVTHDGKTYRSDLNWSPDSKSIAYHDKTGAMYICTVASGKNTLVDTDPRGRGGALSWSPDSKWLAYDKNLPVHAESTAIFIYNLESAKSRQVTSGMFADSAPTFDHKGDFLYFVSSRSFNAPKYDDLGSTWIYNGTQLVLAAPLRVDVKAPLLPTSDEESVKPDTKEKTQALRITTSIRDFVPSAVGEDEVSGVWKGAAGPVNFTLTLVLGAGNKVTGTLESDQGGGKVTGTYDPAAKKLDLDLALEDKTNATISVKISGNMFSGSASAQGMMLDVSATRVSSPKPQAAPAPAAGGKDAVASKDKDAAAKPINITIDFDGFEQRCFALPIKQGRFAELAVNDKNQLIFVRQSSGGTEPEAGIKLFDPTDDNHAEKTVAAGGSVFDITPDGKKILVSHGTSASIQDASAGASGESVVTNGMFTMIDPRVEWKQIYNDAWRIERDFFYDPNMHHVDWKAIHDQYAKMVDDCTTREDVGYVISEMISELNVGHAYYGGGDIPTGPSRSVGMLGADFSLENGAYRISRIVTGAPWDVDARSPLAMPGMNVKQGDYLLAVNGAPLDPTQDPWASFQGMANSVVTLTVSKKPTIDTTAVDVPVKLLADESEIRYRAWIEHNRAYVDAKSNGRVGYIYVPSTGIDGQNDLVRQFLGQTGKEALIIDERWNSGGQIPDRFIELLNRPVTNYWAVRDGMDWVWPPVSHQGPKCMLINGEAGSGGDAFPWYFREEKLGKLIGMRTWGGLVGISGGPGLVDGAGITSPSFAFYKKNGTWGIEGNGVEPDIEVMDDPSLMVDGGDPQLDAAIKEMQDELKRNPYTPPHRPAYPDKRGMGINPKDK